MLWLKMIKRKKIIYYLIIVLFFGTFPRLAKADLRINMQPEHEIESSHSLNMGPFGQYSDEVRLPSNFERKVIKAFNIAQAENFVSQKNISRNDGTTLKAAHKGKASIPHMNNTELIDEANRLNDRLFARDLELGRQEKSAIAETLIEMHKEMLSRWDKALEKTPLGELAEMEGVTWDKDSPNAGIIEDIQPFGMVDFWQGYVNKPEKKGGDGIIKQKPRKTKHTEPAPIKKRQTPK